MKRAEKVKPEEKIIEKALSDAEKLDKKGSKTPKSHQNAVLTALGIVGIITGALFMILPFALPKEALPDLVFPEVPSKASDETAIYSDLTGEKLANEAAKTAPAYCIQTPNGTDGARPQAGLNQAGVVFEAIAEAGITRMAAIYQNPTSAVIGPIRSLRLYYLQWDAPFDCTIVHAGGADDALAAVRSYKDLTENYTYMYRGKASARRWNNLFTTAAYLAQMSADRGYASSNINGFTRMTPDEALRDRVEQTATAKLDILAPAEYDTSALVAKVPAVTMRFGNMANYNVRYTYDVTTNSYDRSYASGAAGDVYVCPEENLDEKDPENICTLKVLSPKVVVAMIVNERKAADNYHENITTVGSGEAYVFQNGYMAHGIWRKNTVADQIRFYDDSGVEIALVPGQTFVEAIPTYGGVEY